MLKAAVASVNAASARLGIRFDVRGHLRNGRRLRWINSPPPLQARAPAPARTSPGAPDSFSATGPDFSARACRSLSFPHASAHRPDLVRRDDPTDHGVRRRDSRGRTGERNGVRPPARRGRAVRRNYRHRRRPLRERNWTYNGITWTDLTGTLPLAPSVRWYPGFDYDPAMGGVILVGGFSAANLGLNDTWLFTGTWKNISATTECCWTPRTGAAKNGAPLYEGGIGGSGAAWDPLLGGFLLTDGCADRVLRQCLCAELAPGLDRLVDD